MASLALGYYTYVDPPEATGPFSSEASSARSRKLAACDGDDACEQRAIESTATALEQERLLNRCLEDAFGMTEKGMCQSKFGGKSVFGLF